MYIYKIYTNILLMKRPSKKVLFSVPEELLKEIDAVAATEHRSRSELVREATRRYIADLPSRRHPLDGSRVREALRTMEEIASKITEGFDSTAVVREMRDARYGHEFDYMPRYNIRDLLSSAFKRLGHDYRVVAVYLFGSHARDTALPNSDIDIAVLLDSDEEHTPLILLRLGRDLEKQTGLKNIDVRLLNDAPLAAKGRIITEGQLVYSEDDRARVDFEVRTRSLYFDFLPHLTHLREAFIKRTAESGL